MPVVLIMGVWAGIASGAAPTDILSPPQVTAAEQPATESADGPSPKRSESLRNSATIYRNTVLVEDTILRGEVFIEGALTVAPQATLTIEPGTVIRFRRTDNSAGGGATLVVRGRILANGNSEKPVRFTSANDGSAGGWDGIVLLASDKKNLLEHCLVEGAEIGCEALFSNLTMKHVQFVACHTGVVLKESTAFITGGGAEASDVGMVLKDSEVDLREAFFSKNRRGVVAAGTSLFLSGATFSDNREAGVIADGCRLRITGSSFASSGIGLGLTSCDGGIDSSRVENNAGDGLLLDRSRLKVSGNEISHNGKAGLRVSDGGSVAWGNRFNANGEYDLYNAGSDNFMAIGNWWGGVPASGIAQRIYGQHLDQSRGKVRYLPFQLESATSGL